jgi:hypothetical protein
MKISNCIGLGIALLAVTVIAGYAKKCADTKRMLNQIADEGYETAHDILFPGKSLESKNLQYGPVIPALL